MKLKIALIVSFLIIGAPVNASKNDFPYWPWVQAGRYRPSSGNGITIWVNMETMKRAGAHKLRLWIKYENDRRDARGIKETLAFEQLECDRDWHTNYSLMMYGTNGHLISSIGGAEAKAVSEPIVPNSLLAGIMPFTCAAGGMQH